MRTGAFPDTPRMSPGDGARPAAVPPRTFISPRLAMAALVAVAGHVAMVVVATA